MTNKANKLRRRKAPPVGSLDKPVAVLNNEPEDDSESFCSDVSDLGKNSGVSASVLEKEDGLFTQFSLNSTLLPSHRFFSHDFLLPFVLFAVAITVRFHALADVDRVIFDEIHYGKFVNWVLTGRYFFDVNPPLGKLILAISARALGFDPEADTFAAPGDDFSSPAQAFAARAPSAFFGALTVPVFYALCRRLTMGAPASALGAAFIALDTMHATQSRLIAVESLLVLLTCLGLLAALAMWDAKRACVLKGAPPTVYEASNVALLLVASGVACGLAVAVRWTAFATPVVVMIVSAFGVQPFCVAPLNWLEVLVLGSSMFFAYFASFAAFFMALQKSGTGDVFMSQPFQMCLLRSKEAMLAAVEGRDSSCKLSLWSMFLELNQKIFEYSKNIRGADKWGSSWMKWCVNWRGALYFRTSRTVEVAGEGSRRMQSIIYTLMNPAMVVVIDALMLVFVGVLFYQIRYRKSVHISGTLKAQLQRGCVLILGWIVSLLPTMVIYRSGPLYQYLPGLVFAQALGALTFDMIFQAGAMQKCVGIIAYACLVAAFLHWSPWVYYQEMSIEDHESLQWLPGWN